MTVRLSTTKRSDEGAFSNATCALRSDSDVGLLCYETQNGVKQERNVKDAHQEGLVKGVLSTALCAVERGDRHGVRAA